MGFSKKSIALVIPQQIEVDLFTKALHRSGITHISSFRTAEEAYEISRRQLFDVFITAMEQPRMNGVVFIQKLRETGNYGKEVHIFICSNVTSDLLALLLDLHVPYIVKRPLSQAAVIEKIQHVLATEESLPMSEILFRDAKAAFINGLYDMAITSVDSVLSENPRLEKAHALRADILLKQGDVVAAKAIFAKLYAENPRSLTAAYKLAHIAILEDNRSEAASKLATLAELNPYHLKILEDAGLSSYQIEDYANAKKYMGQLSSLDETNQTASAVVADAMIRLGEYGGIIAQLSKSHSEKEILQFLNNAGIRLSKGDDVEGALKMYKAAALQLQDKSPLVYAIYYNMGIAYKKLNDRVNALVCFKQALKINPSFEKAQKAVDEMRQVS